MYTEQIIFFLFLAGLFAALILIHILSRGKEMTGPATVVSHRLELGTGGGGYGADNWNRLVTFRLTDGNELELYAIREDYEKLEDGMTGQLTWQKENLLHFDPDTP